MTQVPPITQAMIDAYDAYTHVTLDRRGLIGRLTALAGSSAAAYAVLPLLEASPAKAAIIGESDPRIATSEVEWQGAKGDKMRGYLALPANTTGRLPAVMVIHENRGLTPHIRDVARRTALAGFAAFAPDFLTPAGGTPANEDQAREMIGKLDRERTVANGITAINFLDRHKRSTGQVGAVGFCWGGGMVNALAVAAGSKLQAAVPFYGPVPADMTKVKKIKAKMMLQYAGNDERINAGLPAYKAALTKAGVDWTLHIYNDKQHAFHNDTSAARYDAQAAGIAWNRTIAFLKKTLVV
jgi:carboxymethylenebutenolidase